MFCYTCLALSIHAPCCNYSLLEHVVILLQSLLNNVAVSLLTLSPVFTMCFDSDPCTLWTWSCHDLLHNYAILLLVTFSCHVLLCGEWFKLTNMPTYRCFCHVLLFSPSEFVILLVMFTWVPSYLLCLFGSWSVRDFCSMQLVDSCHAFVCYDLFL